MYEKTVRSSVGLAKFDTTHEHDTGFNGFGLSIIMLTRVTRLVCLFVGLAKFDTTREHNTGFAGLG